MSKTNGCRVPVAVPYPYPYPYMVAGHYGCDCCQEMHQPTVEQTNIPSSGMMKGNLFVVANTTPFVIDQNVFEFGTKTSVSENVETRITRRKDECCINLAGTFDLTDQLITNTALYAFLQSTISSQFATLNSVLPIIRPIFTFKVYYQILDATGSIVDESYALSNIQNGKFHFTDVKDYFIESFHNVIVKNLGPFDYSGIYTLKFTHAELIMSYIDTKEHLVNEFNPFYQFTNNNTSLVLQHNTIMETEPDGTVVIASADLEYATQFQANVTTRLKLSYTAFTGGMSYATDVYGVWTSIFTPTEAIIEEMRNEIISMNETITALTSRVEALEEIIDDVKKPMVPYEKNRPYKVGMLVWMNYGTLYQVTTNYTSTSDPSVTTVEAFNQDIAAGRLVPLAADANVQLMPYDYLVMDDEYEFNIGYTHIDYEYAKEYMRSHYVELGGGCSCFRTGDSIGRNFDWYYDDQAYFVIRVNKGKGVKYNSIGRTGGRLEELTNDFVKSGEYSDAYKVLPFITVDGINECGLFACANVVPAGDYGYTTGTTPLSDKKETLCGAMLIRFVLDNFASASEAVTYIQQHVSVYMPYKEDGDKQELHYMICDAEKTYLLEFIHNELIVSDMDTVYGGRTFMTNFYLYNTSVDGDGNIVPESVSDYGNGLERYNIMSTTESSDVTEIMASLQYSNAYKSDTTPVWKSEYASREYNRKVTDPMSAYTEVIAAAQEAYQHRERNGLLWQSCHTTMYVFGVFGFWYVNQEDFENWHFTEYIPWVPATQG